MEQETLFTASKWDILQSLESGKKSPIDLAQESKTSVANISQQLRLLELAGFVKSERVSNRDKGLPRILYSLSGNQTYLVVSATGFVQKRFMKIQDYQKSILRIWFIENTLVHYYLEKFFWTVEKYLDKVQVLAFDVTDNKTIRVALVSDNADIKKNIKDCIIDGSFGPKQFSIQYMKLSDVEKQSNYHIIHQLSTHT